MIIIMIISIIIIIIILMIIVIITIIITPINPILISSTCELQGDRGVGQIGKGWDPSQTLEFDIIWENFMSIKVEF